MREAVKALKSPSNRIRLEVTGTRPLEQKDIDWLRFLSQKPQYVNDSSAGEMPAGGDEP